MATGLPLPDGKHTETTSTTDHGDPLLDAIPKQQSQTTTVDEDPITSDDLTQVRKLCEEHNIDPITEMEEYLGGMWYYSISFGEEALGHASDVQRHRAKQEAAKLAHESVDSLLCGHEVENVLISRVESSGCV